MSRQEQSADRMPEKAWRRAAMAAALIAAGGGTAAAQAPGAPSAAPAADAAAVILEADQLQRDEANNVIIAEGAVEARFQGRTLRAARVVYDTTRRTIRAEGAVEIIDADGTVRYADDVEVDEDLGAGVSANFGSRLPPTATLAAQTAVRRRDGVTALDRVVYTACPVCADPKDGRPTWTLRARKAVQNPNTKMIAYRDVQLQLRGTPILYLPYFTHADPSAGRRSGFLPPDVGGSQALGAFATVPYFWAISPSQDLTATVNAYGQVAPRLGLQYRKRFFSGDLVFDGSAVSDREFDNDGEKFGEKELRGHLFGVGRFTINDDWRWGFGIERASDDIYLRRYRQSGAGLQRGLFVGDASRLISQANLVRQTETSYGAVSAVAFQGVAGQPDVNLPAVLPVAEFEQVLRDPLLDGQLRLQASTYNLRRENEAFTSRFSAGFKWRAERAFGPGILASPFLEGRADFYRTALTGGASDDAQRSVGVGGVEVRWPFVRPGKRLTLMVEPVAVAAFGTEGGQDRAIPNEDALGFEVDESNVFLPTATPNADLWEPGARYSLGLRAQADLDGRGVGQVVFGRRWREEADPRFAPSTNLDGRGGDYVGAVNLDFANVGGTVRFRLDDRDLSLTRIDAGARASLWRLSTNIRYYSIDEALRGQDPNQQINYQITARLTQRWAATFSSLQDLRTDERLSDSVGLTYRDDCSFFEIAYNRNATFDRRFGPTEGFSIRIGFTTLGEVGSQAVQRPLY